MNEIRIAVDTSADVVAVRTQGREFAREIGFSSTDCTLIATVLSDLAHSGVLAAGRCEIVLNFDRDPDRKGLSARMECRSASNQAAPVAASGVDVELMRRLLDEFEITMQAGSSVVTLRKWLRPQPDTQAAGPN